MGRRRHRPGRAGCRPPADARGHTVTVLGDPSIQADAAATTAEFRPWVRAPHRTSQAPADDHVKDWEVRNPR